MAKGLAYTGQLPPPLSNSENLANDQDLAALPPVAALIYVQCKVEGAKSLASYLNIMEFDSFLIQFRGVINGKTT